MKPFVFVLSLFFAAAAPAAGEPGFVSLFDGKTLKGWVMMARPGRLPYAVENGVLACPEKCGGNLFTEKEYSDFVFRFEFRLTEGANNGVGIRAPLEGRASEFAMEIQILDNDSYIAKGRIKPTQYHGSVYDAIAAKPGFLRKTGAWNEEEITARGRQITVKLNGTVILDADLDSVKDPAVVEKHPGLARRSGHVGFLGHGTRVEFRNIRIKELKP